MKVVDDGSLLLIPFSPFFPFPLFLPPSMTFSPPEKKEKIVVFTFSFPLFSYSFSTQGKLEIKPTADVPPSFSTPTSSEKVK